MSTDENETEFSTAPDSNTLAILNQSEILAQVETARRYPRNIPAFIREATQLVALDEDTAGECIYSLPRREFDKNTGKYETKMITGPSARFAEIIVSCWGNCTSGARVVDDSGAFVVAQGVCHDIQRNNRVMMEVRRPITGKKGRFSNDMIGVTGNAASSIAHRNAVLKAIPKAFWRPAELAARNVIAGTIQTLSARRDKALSYFVKIGVPQENVLHALGVAAVIDITLDHLVVLSGMKTALREENASVDDMFPAPPRADADALNKKLDAEPDGEPEPEAGQQAETAAEPAAAQATATTTRKPRQTRAPKEPTPDPAAEKPPTQSLAPAGIDAGVVGTPGVDTAADTAPFSFETE